MCLQIIYIWYLFIKRILPLNNLQWFICHKSKRNQSYWLALYNTLITPFQKGDPLQGVFKAWQWNASDIDSSVLELLIMSRAPSLLWFLGPIWPRVLVLFKVPSTVQIIGFSHLLRFIITSFLKLYTQCKLPRNTWYIELIMLNNNTWIHLTVCKQIINIW